MSLSFPKQAFFECTSCGKCCRSSFEIPVQNAQLARMRATETYRAVEKEGYQPLRVLAGSFHFVDYDEEERCHFLNSEEMCSLHAEAGSQAKPVICRLYPFTLVNTPDGYSASLLFSCPAVVAGFGGHSSEQEAELVSLLEDDSLSVPQLPEVKEHVLVSQHHTMTWPEYLDFEKQFVREFPTTSDTIIFLIKSVGELLALDGFDESACGELKSCLLSYCGELWEHLGLDELGSFQESLPKSSLQRDCLDRYVLNQVEGKLLLSGPSLVCRLLLVACGLAIANRYYEQMASLQNILHFDFELMAKAFEICEEQIVSQSSEFEDFFAELEWNLLSIPESQE